MLLPEFEDQFRRLRLTYGEKTFPVEREKLFFDRYKRLPASAFKAAVDQVILTLPIPSGILPLIDDCTAKARMALPPEKGGYKSPWRCDPCRDDGFGFVEHTIVRCTCEKGQATSDEEIKRQQENYERGRAMMQGRRLPMIGRPLPYDPTVRGA